ncbi:competence type IV pilus minor pilin ComGD [Scopulibacillus cellulosilyticus]|uniref:Competence type IV pilus minor pilin ComGD n=1 Tax=Scopulibacillus cellulosilyticus TaxID=2665665 RepID=A0ABW2Q0Y4_9BACL
MNQDGFTLIETLIVASIAFIIIPISFVKFASVNQTQTLDYFVKQLKDALHHAQMTAMAEGKTVEVLFDDQNHLVRIQEGGDYIDSFHFDNDIEIEKGTQGKKVTFLSNGHIQKTGTVFIKLGLRQYKLVFLLGQGRYYVEKQ